MNGIFKISKAIPLFPTTHNPQRAQLVPQKKALFHEEHLKSIISMDPLQLSVPQAREEINAYEHLERSLSPGILIPLVRRRSAISTRSDGI